MTGSSYVEAGQFLVVGITDEHGLARGDPGRGLDRSAVQEYPAGVYEALDLAARVTVQTRGQIGVQAQSVVRFLHLEGDFDPGP